MVDEMNRVAASVGIEADLEWASILHGRFDEPQAG
jgi:hypothetical protein